MQTGVIYARTSSSGAAENRQNTERQVIDLREYANYAKLDVKAVFEEHISGAKKNEERQEIMDFIAQYVPYGNDPAIAKRPVISISHKMKDQFMIRRW